MSDGAVRVAAHRLRARYRELLREEVGRTTDDPAAVDEEIGDLMAALAADLNSAALTDRRIRAVGRLQPSPAIFR